MKGLIYKDIINLKSYVKMLLLMFCIFAVIFIPQGQVDFIVGYISLISCMMVVSTMSYDDMAKWDKYALTMPVTRKEVVSSKYLVMLLFTTIGTIIGIIITMISGFFVKEVYIDEMLISAVIVFSIALIFGSVLIPLIYKFGTQKARILIILCALTPTFIVIVGSKIMESLGVNMPTGEVIIKFIYFVPIVSIIILIVSYFISTNIYKRKEF